MTFQFDKGPYDITEGDPKHSDKQITLHTFVLKEVDQDSISLLVDGKLTSLYINDSLALAPDGCVLHLLGVGHELTEEEHEQESSNPNHLSLDDWLKKRAEFVEQASEHGTLNSAFTAFVCP
jgi:hypothetical protein